MKFFRSFQNSILLIVIVTIATLCISLFFAAVLTREKIRGANFFRVVFYISNILSIVVIAGIFPALYDPESGLLNSILSFLQLYNWRQFWLGNQTILLYSSSAALISQP